MKTILFHRTGSAENLKMEDIPNPRPLKVGEVLLRFKAGSLNHLDLWVLKGLPRVTYQFPHICGADLCGEVVQSKSKKFKKGALVLAYPASSDSKNALDKKIPENLRDDFHIRGENAPGVFSELNIIHEKYLMPSPRHLSAQEAAGLPLVYVTAWQMLVEKAGLSPAKKTKDPILVHGAGSGVTQALCELLYSFGYKNIALTSRSPDKLANWAKRGFKVFTANENLESELKAWAGPHKIGVIFDHIGQKYFEMNIRLLRRNGKFVTCGATSGFEGHLDLRHLYFRQLQLLGSTMGSLKHFGDAIRWVAKKKIRPQVSKVFRFDQFQEAYLYMESAEQTGKIILS